MISHGWWLCHSRRQDRSEDARTEAPSLILASVSPASFESRPVKTEERDAPTSLTGRTSLAPLLYDMGCSYIRNIPLPRIGRGIRTRACLGLGMYDTTTTLKLQVRHRQTHRIFGTSERLDPAVHIQVRCKRRPHISSYSLNCNRSGKARLARVRKSLISLLHWLHEITTPCTLKLIVATGAGLAARITAAD